MKLETRRSPRLYQKCRRQQRHLFPLAGAVTVSSRAETRRAEPLKAAVLGSGRPCDLASDFPCCVGAHCSYDNALLRRFVGLAPGLASAATAIIFPGFVRTQGCQGSNFEFVLAPVLGPILVCKTGTCLGPLLLG